MANNVNVGHNTVNYANDKQLQAKIQQDLADAQRAIAKGDKAGAAKAAKALRDDMNTAQSQGNTDIWMTKAANGATYGNIMGDLLASTEKGELGKAGQDVYQLASQSGMAGDTTGALTSQMQGTRPMNFDAGPNATADRQAFVKAWGNGDTEFAQEFKRNNPNAAKLLSGNFAPDKVKDLKGTDLDDFFGRVVDVGMQESSTTLYTNDGTDHSILVADKKDKTIQGYAAGGGRQGTDAYDTQAPGQQYISSGGATLLWDNGDGGWSTKSGVTAPTPQASTPEQQAPAPNDDDEVPYTGGF